MWVEIKHSHQFLLFILQMKRKYTEPILFHTKQKINLPTGSFICLVEKSVKQIPNKCHLSSCYTYYNYTYAATVTSMSIVYTQLFVRSLPRAHLNSVFLLPQSQFLNSNFPEFIEKSQITQFNKKWRRIKLNKIQRLLILYHVYRLSGVALPKRIQTRFASRFEYIYFFVPFVLCSRLHYLFYIF